MPSTQLNDFPHPHPPCTFGFCTAKPLPWRLSRYSRTEPCSMAQLSWSTQTLAPFFSMTKSLASAFFSNHKPYVNPEQPPGMIFTRNSQPSLSSFLANSRIFFAALEVTSSTPSALVSLFSAAALPTLAHELSI